jgi:hypothetical protein
MNFNLQGRAMADAVSRLPFTEEARFRSYASLLEVCGGQSGAETGFSPKFRLSSVNIIPPMRHTHLQLHAALTRRTNVRTLGANRKQSFFGNRGALDRKILSVFQSSESFALASCSMTSILNILFHLISPLQRDDRRRKERKGEVEGCVINCRIIHSQRHLLQAEYHTAIVKDGKHSVPAHAACCCYLCVKFTELFQIFIASHILRKISITSS